MRAAKYTPIVVAALSVQSAGQATPTPAFKCAAGATAAAAVSSKTRLDGARVLHGQVAVQEQTALEGAPVVILGFIQKDGRQVQVIFENAFPKRPDGWFYAFRAYIEVLKPGGGPSLKSGDVIIDMRNTVFDLRMRADGLELALASKDPNDQPTSQTVKLDVPQLDTSELTLVCYGAVYSFSQVSPPMESPQ